MASKPSSRFTEQKNKNPEIFESFLLNSHNRTKFTGKADIVFGRAGIIGLLYAIHLKHISPNLKIEVFEKSQAPVPKIRESTLSTFSRLVLGEILTQEYLLRLFSLKDGLQFYCIDDKGLKVMSRDIGGPNVSFELDRGMLELFFTMWAQQMGINVYHGVDVTFGITNYEDQLKPNGLPGWLPTFGWRTPRAEKSFKTPLVELKHSSGEVNGSVDAKMVCDATGFSRKLTSKFGKNEAFDGWNCNAY
jgi:hypothetical protein